MLTFVSADEPDRRRIFVLGAMDDKQTLTPSMLLGITAPDALCIKNIITAVLTADSALYASAFDARSCINNCNYDSMIPGTSIHSGEAHDAEVQKGRVFFKNCFENYLHWSSGGGRFVCATRLDKHHTLVIMGKACTGQRRATHTATSQLRVLCIRAQRTVHAHRRLCWNIHTRPWWPFTAGRFTQRKVCAGAGVQPILTLKQI